MATSGRCSGKNERCGLVPMVPFSGPVSLKMILINFLIVTATALATKPPAQSRLLGRDSVCEVPAHGNGTDDSPAILAAVEKCGQGGTIVFSNTTYHVEKVMNTTGMNNVEIQLRGTLLVRLAVVFIAPGVLTNGNGVHSLARISTTGSKTPFLCLVTMQAAIKTNRLPGSLVATMLPGTATDTARLTAMVRPGTTTLMAATTTQGGLTESQFLPPIPSSPASVLCRVRCGMTLHSRSNLNHALMAVFPH
jgi:hypothetical protein